MRRAIPKCYMKVGLLELAITDVLSQNSFENGMTTDMISEKLEEIGIERTYDTLMRHLKKMVDSGAISRKAIHTEYGTSWEYYYKL